MHSLVNPLSVDLSIPRRAKVLPCILQQRVKFFELCRACQTNQNIAVPDEMCQAVNIAASFRSRGGY
jgi:hypothetical protein